MMIRRSGTINAPIARKENSIIERCVNINGDTAITHYNVLKNNVDYSLVYCLLETGRTHQIRVHMSHIGYPVVGDIVYSNGKNPFGVEGQMLHSYKLVFCHPITNETLSLQAPLPKYFEEVLEILRKK